MNYAHCLQRRLLDPYLIISILFDVLSLFYHVRSRITASLHPSWTFFFAYAVNTHKLTLMLVLRMYHTFLLIVRKLFEAHPLQLCETVPQTSYTLWALLFPSSSTRSTSHPSPAIVATNSAVQGIIAV